MPLTNVPELEVVGWAPVEDVYFSYFSSPQNLAMHVLGKGLRQANIPKPVKRPASMLLLNPNQPAPSQSSSGPVYQKVFKLIRPGMDSDAVMHLLSKAKITNKTQPFHLFQSISPQNNLTTYATVHEYHSYRLEARKCPIGLFANMKVTPALLDSYGLIACIGIEICNDEFLHLKVITNKPLGYNIKKIIRKEHLSRKIANHIAHIYSLLFSSSNEELADMVVKNNQQMAEYLVQYATTEKQEQKTPLQLVKQKRMLSKGKLSRTNLTPVPQSPIQAESPIIHSTKFASKLAASPSNISSKPLPSIPKKDEHKRMSLRKRVSASSILSKLTQRSHEFLRSSYVSSSNASVSAISTTDSPAMSPKPHSESLEPFASFANPSTSNTAVDRYTTNVSNNTDAHKHGELANNKATEKTGNFSYLKPKTSFSFLRRGGNSSKSSKTQVAHPEASTSSPSLMSPKSPSTGFHNTELSPSHDNGELSHHYDFPAATAGSPQQQKAPSILRKKSFVVPSSPAIPEEPANFDDQPQPEPVITANSETISSPINRREAHHTEPISANVSPKPSTYHPYHARSHAGLFSSRKPGSLIRHVETNLASMSHFLHSSQPRPISSLDTVGEADFSSSETESQTQIQTSVGPKTAKPSPKASTEADFSNTDTTVEIQNNGLLTTPFIARSASDMASLASSAISQTVKDSDRLLDSSPNNSSSPANSFFPKASGSSVFSSRRHSTSREGLLNSETDRSYGTELEVDCDDDDDVENDLDFDNEAFEEEDKLAEELVHLRDNHIFIDPAKVGNDSFKFSDSHQMNYSKQKNIDNTNRYENLLPMDEIENNDLPIFPTANSFPSFGTANRSNYQGKPYLQAKNNNDTVSNTLAEPASTKPNVVMDRVPAHITTDQLFVSEPKLNAAANVKMSAHKRLSSESSVHSGSYSFKPFETANMFSGPLQAAQKPTAANVSAFSDGSGSKDSSSSFITDSDSQSFVTIDESDRNSHAHSRTNSQSNSSYVNSPQYHASAHRYPHHNSRHQTRRHHHHKVSDVSNSTSSSSSNSAVHDSVREWYDELQRENLDNASLDSLSIDFAPGTDSVEHSYGNRAHLSDTEGLNRSFDNQKSLIGLTSSGSINQNTYTGYEDIRNVEDSGDSDSSSFENLTRFLDEPIGSINMMANPNFIMPSSSPDEIISASADPTAPPGGFYYSTTDGIVDTNSSSISLHHHRSYGNDIGGPNNGENGRGMFETPAQYAIRSLNKQKSMPESFTTTTDKHVESLLSNAYDMNELTPVIGAVGDSKDAFRPPKQQLGSPAFLQKTDKNSTPPQEEIQKGGVVDINDSLRDLTISESFNIPGNFDINSRPFLTAKSRPVSVGESNPLLHPISNTGLGHFSKLSSSSSLHRISSFKRNNEILSRSASGLSTGLSEDFSYLAKLINNTETEGETNTEFQNFVDSPSVGKNGDLPLNKAASLYSDIRNSSLLFLGSYIQEADKCDKKAASIGYTDNKSLKNLSESSTNSSELDVATGERSILRDFLKNGFSDDFSENFESDETKEFGQDKPIAQNTSFLPRFSQKQNEFVQTARQDDCLPFNQPSQPSQYDLPTDSFHNKMGSWSGTSILNFAANINRSTPDEFGERGSKRHSSLNRAFYNPESPSDISASTIMPVDEFNSTFGESNNNVRVPSYGDRRVSSYGNNSNFERVIGLNTDGRNRVASNPSDGFIFHDSNSEYRTKKTDEEEIMSGILGEPLNSSSARNSLVNNSEDHGVLRSIDTNNRNNIQSNIGKVNRRLALNNKNEFGQLSIPKRRNQFAKKSNTENDFVFGDTRTNHPGCSNGRPNTHNTTGFHGDERQFLGNNNDKNTSNIDRKFCFNAEDTNSDSVDSFPSSSSEIYLEHLHHPQHQQSNSIYDDGNESFASIVHDHPMSTRYHRSFAKEANSTRIASSGNRTVSREMPVPGCQDLNDCTRDTVLYQNRDVVSPRWEAGNQENQQPLSAIQLQQAYHQQQQTEIARDIEILRKNSVRTNARFGVNNYQHDNEDNQELIIDSDMVRVRPRIHSVAVKKKSREFVLSSLDMFNDISPNEIHLRTLMTSIESLINEEFASIMAIDTIQKRLSGSSASSLNTTSFKHQASGFITNLDNNKLMGTTAIAAAKQSPFSLVERQQNLILLEQINDTVFNLFERTRGLKPLRGTLLAQDQQRVVNVENINRQTIMSCAWSLISIQERYRQQYQYLARVYRQSGNLSDSDISKEFEMYESAKMPGLSSQFAEVSATQPLLHSSFQHDDDYLDDGRYVGSTKSYSSRGSNQCKNRVASNDFSFSNAQHDSNADNSSNSNKASGARSFQSHTNYNLEMYKKYSVVVSHFFTLEWARRSEMIDKLGSANSCVSSNSQQSRQSSYSRQSQYNEVKSNDGSMAIDPQVHPIHTNNRAFSIPIPINKLPKGLWAVS